MYDVLFVGFGIIAICCVSFFLIDITPNSFCHKYIVSMTAIIVLARCFCCIGFLLVFLFSAQWAFLKLNTGIPNFCKTVKTEQSYSE